MGLRVNPEALKWFLHRKKLSGNQFAKDYHINRRWLTLMMRFELDIGKALSTKLKRIIKPPKHIPLFRYIEDEDEIFDRYFGRDILD